MLVLPFYHCILLRCVNTSPLVDDALLIVIVIYFEILTIVTTYVFHKHIELPLHKLTEFLDQNPNFRLVLHEMQPSKPAMIINNGEKITLTIISADLEWSPYMCVHEFNTHCGERLAHKKMTSLLFSIVT